LIVLPIGSTGNFAGIVLPRCGCTNALFVIVVLPKFTAIVYTSLSILLIAMLLDNQLLQFHMDTFQLSM
jgi:hypothetical protein